jgi:predicted nucleic acid-binding protein
MSDGASSAGGPAQPANPATGRARVHLDTSFLVRALVRGSREDRLLRLWIQQGGVIAISSIGWAEFLCGPVSEGDRPRVRTILGAPIAVGEIEAEHAARLFNVGGRRRGSLPDCLIAATALAAGATLATSNVQDFVPFEEEGLKIASGV